MPTQLAPPRASTRRTRAQSPEETRTNRRKRRAREIVFDDRVARPRLVAGIAGPSDRPDRDWRLFRAAIEEFRALDARGYACLLDDVYRTVRGYVLSRPDQFRVTT